MSFYIGDLWRKIQPTTNRVLKDELVIAEQEILFAELNNDQSPNQNEGIRRRILASTDLGSTEKDVQPNEDGLCSTEKDVQPNEDGLCSAEKDEQPNEMILGTTETDEQPNEDGLCSTENEQPIEDKLKKLTDAKLVLFDGTTTFYGFLVPLAAVIIGSKNIFNCPANLYIPYMVTIIGLLSLLIVGYVCLKTKSKNFYCLEKNERQKIKMLSALMACVWIFQVALLSFMDVSFDSSADNYCDFAFYIFTIVMNTFVVLGFNIGLGLLFYDPDFFNRTYSETPAYRLLPFEFD